MIDFGFVALTGKWFYKSRLENGNFNRKEVAVIFFVWLN